MPSPIDSQLKAAFEQKNYLQIKALLETYIADHFSADAKSDQPRPAVTIEPSWWGEVTQHAGNDAGTILHLMRKAGGRLPNVTLPLPVPKFKFFFPVLQQAKESEFSIQLQDAIKNENAKLIAKLINKVDIYDLVLFSKNEITIAFVLLTMTGDIDAINKLFNTGLVNIIQACIDSPLLTNVVTSAKTDSQALGVVEYLLNAGVKETICRVHLLNSVMDFEMKREFFYAAQAANQRKFVKTEKLLTTSQVKAVSTPASAIWRLEMLLTHATLTFVPNVVLAELLCDLINQDKDKEASQLLARIMQDYAYGALLTPVSFTGQFPIHVAAIKGKQQLIEQMLAVAPYTQLHAEDINRKKPQAYAEKNQLKTVLNPDRRDVDLIDYDWYVTHLPIGESVDKKRHETLQWIKLECKKDDPDRALRIKQHLSKNKDTPRPGKNVNNSISNRLTEQANEKLIQQGKVLLAYCDANHSGTIYTAKQAIVAACAKTAVDSKQQGASKAKGGAQTAAVMLLPVNRI